MDVDEQENEMILARLVAANKGFTHENGNDPAKPCLTNYTDADMPTIHDEVPLALLEGLSKDQLIKWLQTLTGKVLARPFDTEVKHQPNHVEIAKSLIAAANEITGQANVAVAAPIRDKNNPDVRKHPITFLIHNLTPSGVRTLIDRKVWSSSDISFQISPLNPEKPDFLFTLTGLLAPEPSHVQNLLEAACRDSVTESFVKDLVQRTHLWKRPQLSLDLENFLNSISVTDLGIKSKGGKNDPHYNVYADSKTIKDDQTWSEIRDFLKMRAYPSHLYGRGAAKKRPFYCSLCHGSDHLRGLCPFPKIPGWNGGKRHPAPPAHSNFAGNAGQSQPPHAFRYGYPPNGNSIRNLPRKSI